MGKEVEIQVRHVRRQSEGGEFTASVERVTGYVVQAQRETDVHERAASTEGRCADCFHSFTHHEIGESGAVATHRHRNFSQTARNGERRETRTIQEGL